MTITEYKELCKKDVLRIGQDVKEIKLGTNVKSKIHDDLTGSVVLLDGSNDYAVVMTDIIEYEMMTVECPQCSSQIEIPKISGSQELKCPDCGLEGEIDI